MSTFSVDKLKFSYDDNEILKDISFKIKKPSFVSIIGSNNCGKTTIIKCLSGIMPIEDLIMIDDIVLNKKNIKKYSREIGVVFTRDQNQFLFDKVIDEITFPLCNLKYSKKEIKAAVNEISKLLFIDELLDKELKQLNEVEKLKVLLATELIYKPKVLLLDDVLIGFSDGDRERILLILKRVIREMGIIIIATTSLLADTIYSDAILVIDDGIIRYSGNIETILEYDNILTRLGIEIPVMVDMSLKLKFYNLLNRVILDEREMVDALWE